MIAAGIEGKWIDTFVSLFQASEVRAGESVAILSETLSRQQNVKLAELALHQIGARPFHVIIPTPRQTVDVVVRSTGSTNAMNGQEAALKALASADVVIDMTVEMLLHAPELPQILAGGARLLSVSNEHPEVFERVRYDPRWQEHVVLGMQMLDEAKTMRVTSDAGTDLTIRIENIQPVGGWGNAARPHKVGSAPGALIAFYPNARTVNGRIVLNRGDINLTFKRYIEDPVSLTIEDDYITDIDGDSLDAELMRSYFSAWGDREAFAMSHMGWGMTPGARWDSLIMYDKNDVNGAELRAFAGNFLWSSGANEAAGRHTLGHFDIPMRNCTIALDDKIVVDRGVLQAPLAYDLPSREPPAAEAPSSKKVYLGYTFDELELAGDPRALSSNWEEVFAEMQKLGSAARAADPPTTHSYAEGERGLIDVHATNLPAGAPALIFFHGGGWQLGSKEDMAFMAPVLNGAGIAYLSPNYPLAPNAPMAKITSACRDAVIWVYRNADKLGIDRNRIFVGGASAGAHLSAHLLTLDWSAYGLPKMPFKGGILLSTVYDLTPIKLQKSRAYVGLTDADVEAFSPVRHVSQMSSPLLVAWAENDPPLIGQLSDQLVEKVKAAGIPVERYVEAGKNHFDFAFTLADPSSDLSRKIVEMVQGKPVEPGTQGHAANARGNQRELA
ncbi:MAG TPA: alpha/beta hydrolase fold domain-containing protein [Allosphingosinicella sp.]|nr:alpha/beta hydrolase fold domain-containing protein [Allosphingosinicella sp.]